MAGFGGRSPPRPLPVRREAHPVFQLLPNVALGRACRHPSRAPETAGPRGCSARSELPGMIPPTRTETVLVVDDCKDLCTLIEILLCRVGSPVLAATNGDDALDLARTTPEIGLLLTKLGTPGMRGDSAGRACRRAAWIMSAGSWANVHSPPPPILVPVRAPQHAVFFVQCRGPALRRLLRHHALADPIRRHRAGRPVRKLTGRSAQLPASQAPFYLSQISACRPEDLSGSGESPDAFPLQPHPLQKFPASRTYSCLAKISARLPAMISWEFLPF